MDFQISPCFLLWFSCIHFFVCHFRWSACLEPLCCFKLAHNGFGLGEGGDFHHKCWCRESNFD